MSFEDNYPHAKFGIDEVYIHEGLSYNLLERLYQRAVFTLDSDEIIVQKHVSHDMVLIFNKQTPTSSLIYRYLKLIDQDVNKKDYIKSNLLVNEEELLSVIKSKKFILVTHRTLVKEIYSPELK